MKLKNHTVLLWLSHAKQLPASVNGNPRWLFYARPAGGTMEKFKTASDVMSAYGFNFDNLKLGDVIRATYHETAAGTLMVTVWGDCRSLEVNLTDEFDALELKHQLYVEVRNPQTSSTQRRL